VLLAAFFGDVGHNSDANSRDSKKDMDENVNVVKHNFTLILLKVKGDLGGWVLFSGERGWFFGEMGDFRGEKLIEVLQKGKMRYVGETLQFDNRLNHIRITGSADNRSSFFILEL